MLFFLGVFSTSGQRGDDEEGRRLWAAPTTCGCWAAQQRLRRRSRTSRPLACSSAHTCSAVPLHAQAPRRRTRRSNQRSERDTPAVSLPLLTLSSGYATIVKVRLCDYCSPCRQPVRQMKKKIQNGSCWEFGQMGLGLTAGGGSGHRRGGAHPIPRLRRGDFRKHLH